MAARTKANEVITHMAGTNRALTQMSVVAIAKTDQDPSAAAEIGCVSGERTARAIPDSGPPQRSPVGGFGERLPAP
jgi:hypothetical protein